MKDFFTGTTVSKGCYICMSCADAEHPVIIDDKGVLPECPTCGATQWIKLESEQ